MIIIIFFTIVTVVLPPVASAEPVLSLNVTHDVSLICNMDGFSGHIDWLGSLQIVKRHGFEDGSDALLATVIKGRNNTNKTMASDRLKELYPSHHIAGEVNPERPYQSWLTLMLINMDEDMNGGYVCMINYMDHPADIKQRNWTTELTVNASRQEIVQHKGFSVVPGRGISASCVAELDSRDLVSHIMIVSEDGKSLASWSKGVGYVTKSLVSPVFRPQEETFQAHLLNVACTDVSKYQCKVTWTSGSLSECPPESLPLEGCSLSINYSSTSALPGTETKTTKIDCLPAKAVIPITVSVSLVIIVNIFVICLYKRGKLCFKSSQKEKGSEKKTNEEGKNLEEKSLNISSGTVEANGSVENELETERSYTITINDLSLINVKIRNPETFSDDGVKSGIGLCISKCIIQ